MKSKIVLFCVLIVVVLLNCSSTASSLRKEYISSCSYYEEQVANLVNDIVTISCHDTDAQTNKVFPPQASVYLDCANKKKANGYQAGNIVFKGCQMSRIKYNISTVFIRLHTLNISGIELQSLPSSFFSGAKFLKTLIASNNRLLEIPSFQFAHCPVLRSVDYSYNKINRIDGDAFGGVSSTMQQLNLSHNHLTELPPSFFSNLSKLEILDLSYNSIEHLVPLTNLSKLVNLNLSFNNIKDLPDAMILSQPDLRFLQVSHNNLTTLKMDTFAKQRNLHLLDLSYNSIRKVDFNTTRMEHLEKFYVNNNQLTDLVGFKNLIFPILNSFAITGNKFNCSYLTTFVNWFDYHSSLSVLQQNKETENDVNLVQGISCYNISYPSTIRDVEETSTVSSFDYFPVPVSSPTLENAVIPQATNNIPYDKATTEPNSRNVLTKTVQLHDTKPHSTLPVDDTSRSISSHSVNHYLLIVLCFVVTLNVAAMIIMIIRNRKSTLPTNGGGYNCAYNTAIGPRFSSGAVENQYETVLVGGKRCDDSDLI